MKLGDDDKWLIKTPMFWFRVLITMKKHNKRRPIMLHHKRRKNFNDWLRDEPPLIYRLDFPFIVSRFQKLCFSFCCC